MSFVPASSPAQAAREFSEKLQLVVSAVTDDGSTIRGGYYAFPNPHAMTFVDCGTIRMHGAVRLALSADLRYRLVQSVQSSSKQSWNVEIVSCMYAIRERNRAEIESWHWHPGIPGIPSYPHLHLDYAAKVGREEFHHAHLPTGIVTLADIVRSAITDLHVEPRREDRQAILDDALNST